MHKFLDALEHTPIVQHACEQCGISRNTFYRWMKEDPDFRVHVLERMEIGTDLVNDFAESNVLNGIKNRDPGLTKFWLSHRHESYKRRYFYPPAPEEKKPSDEETRAAVAEIQEWMSRWPSIKQQRAEKKREEREKKRKRNTKKKGRSEHP